MSRTEQLFISEPIRPNAATADTSAMAAGYPGLPSEFIWRGKTLGVAAVLRTWRETGSCRHGSPESYVRKHWYDVETGDGRRAKIYFERQSRSRDIKKRWWLFSIQTQEPEE